MTIANGSRHSMAYVEESTYGTTPATPTLTPIRHTGGVTLALSKETIQSEELRSDRQIADVRHGNYQVGGDIPVELSLDSFDDFLEAVFCGTWATDTPSVGTDELKVGTTRRSFTIERLFADITEYHRFTGCEFNTFSLEVAPNAMVTATFGVVGSNMSTASSAISGSSYNSATTTSPVDSFTGTLTEGGSSIAVITAINLTLENGIEPLFVIGQKNSIEASIGRSNVTGEITAYFEDSTLLDKFINETESSIQFELPDGTNKYTFIIPRVKYNGGQPDVSDEGEITLAMPFQALLDSSTSTNLIIRKSAV